MMIKEAIEAFFAAIGAKLSGAWDWLLTPIWDGWPLWWSYGVFILILLACLLIGFFLQFKWVRLALGVIVLGAAAWLTGRHTMYGEMKAKLDAERAKKKAPPAPPPEPRQDGGWPWKW
jgi:hypothetical protein